MKFLCAVYLEPNALQGLSASEQANLNRDSLQYDDELAKKGYYIAASALQPPRTAKTVRHRGGRPVVTDGPFAETKEALGGFILIEARDMEEAVRIAEHSRREVWKHRGAARNEDWIASSRVRCELGQAPELTWYEPLLSFWGELQR